MKTITVEVLGGVVAAVRNGETGCIVRVQDYDIEGVDPEELAEDDSGHDCLVSEYMPDNPLPETHLEVQNAVVRAALDEALKFIMRQELKEPAGQQREKNGQLLAGVRSAILIMEGRKNVEG